MNIEGVFQTKEFAMDVLSKSQEHCLECCGIPFTNEGDVSLNCIIRFSVSAKNLNEVIEKHTEKNSLADLQKRNKELEEKLEIAKDELRKIYGEDLRILRNNLDELIENFNLKKRGEIKVALCGLKKEKKKEE